MLNEILSRLLWAAALIAAGWLAWTALNRWLLARAGQHSSASGMRSILYFTTPTCAPCQTFQRPAIERVQRALGDSLRVVEVDAARQPELAQQWGVLSVPTTFILDAAGRPRHVNHGLTNAEQLLQQLQTL